MERDIRKIVRDLEDKKNNDVIFKKDKLYEIFCNDPDLLEILGSKEPRSYRSNMTEEERQEVDDYNERIKRPQIVRWMKLNDIQKEVLNFIMYEIEDEDVSYVNDVIKNQYIHVTCLVHEDDMDTEYGIARTDLLSYIVKDLLCWTNELGMHLKCVRDTAEIVDSKYYARFLKFKTEVPNNIQGGGNRYDRLLRKV